MYSPVAGGALAKHGRAFRHTVRRVAQVAVPVSLHRPFRKEFIKTCRRPSQKGLLWRHAAEAYWFVLSACQPSREVPDKQDQAIRYTMLRVGQPRLQFSLRWPKKSKLIESWRRLSGKWRLRRHAAEAYQCPLSSAFSLCRSFATATFDCGTRFCRTHSVPKQRQRCILKGFDKCKSLRLGWHGVHMHPQTW